MSTIGKEAKIEKEAKFGKDVIDGWTTITYPDGTILKAESAIFLATGIVKEIDNVEKVVEEDTVVACTGQFSLEKFMDMQNLLEDAMRDMGQSILDNLLEEHGEEVVDEIVKRAMANQVAKKVADRILGGKPGPITMTREEYENLSQEQKDNIKKDRIRAGSDCTCSDCRRLRAEIEKEDKK